MTLPPREGVGEEDGVLMSQPWPEAPWPIGATTNAKRAGWNAYFQGHSRERCPFPPIRRDLQAGYREGWDAALNAPSASPESPLVSQEDQNLLRARIKELEGERDKLQGAYEAWSNIADERLGAWNRARREHETSEVRAQKAEAELQRMRGALTRISANHIKTPEYPHGHHWHADCDACHRQDIARQALLPSDQISTQSSTS